MAGVELHRHYAGSTACLPSRTTLLTGQYPGLHGVTSTDGLAQQSSDPAMSWLDPGTVATLGDWFRFGGYRTHCRGKWYISRADLPVAGADRSVSTNDDKGFVNPDAVGAHRRADRLGRFGFSSRIGSEPHVLAPADCGMVKDAVYADQVVELFSELSRSRSDGPWPASATYSGGSPRSSNRSEKPSASCPCSDDELDDLVTLLGGAEPGQTPGSSERDRFREAVSGAGSIYDRRPWGDLTASSQG